MDFNDLLRESEEDSEYLSFSDVANSMPGSCHTSTVVRWTTRGVKGIKLPVIAFGGRKYILRSELLKFLAALNDKEPPPDAREERQSAAMAAAVDALLGSKGK